LLHGFSGKLVSLDAGLQMRRLIRTVLVSALALAALMPAVVAQTAYEPKAIKYDPARLKSYSVRELMDLLSSSSVEINAKATGIYSVLPPDLEARTNVTEPGFSPTHPFDPQADINLSEKLDPHAADYAAGVEQELVTRHPVADMADIFSRTEDKAQQAWIVDVFSQMHDPQADARMHGFMTPGLDEKNYLAARYFAGKCDAPALKILNQNYGKYGISSLERASLAKIFGACRYTPAVPNLADSINAMILNLGQAAHDSLSRMYPDAHIAATNPTEMQKAWQSYIRAHPPG
jgi:hypothetical protein